MKTIDKKAFFFDFDGTIWFGQFGEKTLKALNDLHKNGHLLFYNSGRSKANSRFDLLKEIPFDGFLYGGCHVEASDGETLYISNISKEAMRDTVEIEKRFDLLIIYEGTQSVCKRKGILDWIPCTELEDNSSLIDVKAYPMSKFSIFKKNDIDGEIKPIPKEALELLSKHYILIEMGSYVECIQKGHGKDVAIKKAVENFGIDINNTFAFGDSMNDYPMFKACARGVAIGENAPEKLKELAVYVTKDRLNGVWEALKQFGLVE